MVFSGIDTSFPSSEKLESPFDLHHFTVPYFETLLLGNRVFINSILPNPEHAILSPASTEPTSPQTLTQSLHRFLAETQAITRSQISKVDEWTFVNLDVRSEVMSGIRESVAKNTVYAMQIVAQLFRQGSDVMVSSPDIPRPLELREIGYSACLGRYALTLQEYQKKPPGQTTLPPSLLQPQPQQVQIPFHEDDVLFSLA